jgi:mono/diheme cytochrome c family protein
LSYGPRFGKVEEVITHSRIIATVVVLGLSLTLAASAAGEDPLASGRAIYEANCIACHGKRGDGRGEAAAAIVGARPRDFTTGRFRYGAKPEELFQTITRGVPGTAMPSWKSLPEEERRAVIAYVLSFAKAPKPPKVTGR